MLHNTMTREKTQGIQGPNISGYELTKPAQEVVADYARFRGVHKKMIVERVMLFFAKQPPIMKRLMTGDIDEGTEETYAAMLQAMAEGVRGGSLGKPEYREAAKEYSPSKGSGRPPGSKGTK